MDRYVAQANVDHYLGLLNSAELEPHNRSTITKLLIAEEDQLARDLEHLEFAEIRVARGRARLIHVRGLREAFAPGSKERQEADRLIVNVENTLTLLEDLCHRLRDQINGRRI